MLCRPLHELATEAPLLQLIAQTNLRIRCEQSIWFVWWNSTCSKIKLSAEGRSTVFTRFIVGLENGLGEEEMEAGQFLQAREQFFDAIEGKNRSRREKGIPGFDDAPQVILQNMVPVVDDDRIAARTVIIALIPESGRRLVCDAWLLESVPSIPR